MSYAVFSVKGAKKNIIVVNYHRFNIQHDVTIICGILKILQLE